MKRIISNRALNILSGFLKNFDPGSYKILIPSNICHDVVFLLKFMGIKIIFIDIEKNTLGLNTQQALEKITSLDKLILLWNHTYGNEDIPFDFFQKAKSINPELVIIDDRCLCNPLNFHSNSDDILIDLILFSTGYGKQIELNYGAIGIVNSKYNIGSHYHDFDEEKHYKLKELLQNSNTGELSAFTANAWTRVNIAPLEEKNYMEEVHREANLWAGHKMRLFELFSGEINSDLLLAERFNKWRFNILVDNKDEILGQIKKEGLFASGHYQSLGSILTSKKFEVSEWVYNHVVNLFIDKHFTIEMAYKTAKLINKYANPI